MSTLWDWILSYCKNDVVKAERMIEELRYKALECEESSEEEDSDFESESEVESESELESDEEETIEITRDKDGFYKLK